MEAVYGLETAHVVIVHGRKSATPVTSLLGKTQPVKADADALSDVIKPDHPSGFRVYVPGCYRFFFGDEA